VLDRSRRVDTPRDRADGVELLSATCWTRARCGLATSIGCCCSTRAAIRYRAVGGVRRNLVGRASSPSDQLTRNAAGGWSSSCRTAGTHRVAKDQGSRRSRSVPWVDRAGRACLAARHLGRTSGTRDTRSLADRCIRVGVRGRESRAMDRHDRGEFMAMMSPRRVPSVAWGTSITAPRDGSSQRRGLVRLRRVPRVERDRELVRHARMIIICSRAGRPGRAPRGRRLRESSRTAVASPHAGSPRVPPLARQRSWSPVSSRRTTCSTAVAQLSSPSKMGRRSL
jgi:hypothetical protein